MLIRKNENTFNKSCPLTYRTLALPDHSHWELAAESIHLCFGEFRVRPPSNSL